MSTYNSLLEVVDANVMACAPGDPGAITVNSFTGKLSPSTLSPNDSQWGVYYTSQEWSAFYTVGTVWTFAQVKSNLGYSADDQVSKTMIFWGAMYDTQGQQVAVLDSAAATIEDRVDPDDRRHP